jgi:hypothetical protein
MKKINSLLFGLLLSVFSLAQDLVQDQNPNYKASLEKYMKLEDSLGQNMNTTVQQTYTAPDWYDQKQQRRADRKNFRRQIRLANAQNRGFNNRWNNDLIWNNGFNNRWNNNWGWNNNFNNNWGWNNNLNNNLWGWGRPTVGFNLGDFWFGF